MQSEEEIISYIRDNVKDDENTYLLCDCLENIVTGKYTKYDIQLIVSGLLNLYKKEKEQNSLIKEKLKELNISMETLIGEFNRLEDLEDDTIQLKWRLKEEKEKNKELENKRKTTMEVIGANYIHKDKIREKMEELKKEMLKENISLADFYQKKFCYAVLQKILEE